MPDIDDGKRSTTITLEVPTGYQEEGRLDVYITRFVENASRTKVQKSIKKGHVQVNGEGIEKPSHTVQAGDRIVCTIMRPPPVEVVPQPIPLDIVYEDEWLLVVNKEAGMVVHPAYGHRDGTLVNAVLHHVGGPTVNIEDVEDEDEDDDVGLSTMNAAPARAGDPAIRPGIVHRLDKDTSGLLVVAKDDVTHAGLAEQFMKRTVRRRYVAILWGIPEPAKGTVETQLGRDPRDRKRMAVVDPPRGKHAVTHFSLLERFAYTSLVVFHLESGRTHQIRVHARHLGHPVLGDPVYGGQAIHYGSAGSSRKAFFRRLFEGMPRQALHAQTLGFTHPRTGEDMDFTSEPPEDMHHVLHELRRVEGVRKR